MAVQFHTYNPQPRLGADYAAIREFMLRLDDTNFHFGAWDWIITHRYLDEAGLSKIGIWTDGGKVVAVTPFDTTPKNVYLIALPEYTYLHAQMLDYALTSMGKDGVVRINVKDGDLDKQALVMRHGYVATRDKEEDAVCTFDTAEFAYTLPEGFRITSMMETYDLYQYGKVLYEGFGHEARGRGPYVYDEAFYKSVFERPNVNRDIKIAAVAPDGEFAAYCGMWQDSACESALVEPVATIPKYRKMGLGRAVVLEGMRRCAALGVKRAFVGSSQQFYYNIGFRPAETHTWWEKKQRRAIAE